MRPQSEIRCDLAAALLDGPGTSKELAQRTGWSIGLTRTALDNMVRAGDACRVGVVRIPGVRRPLRVYGKAVREADAIVPGHRHLSSALAGWSRWPSYVGVSA